MKTFPCTVEEKKAEIPEQIKNSFEDPLIFYFTTKDQESFVGTNVIFDPKRERFLEIKSDLGENKNKITRFLNPEGIRDTPHTSATVDKGKFLTTFLPIFSRNNKALRVLDLNKEIFELYTSDDFGISDYSSVCASVTEIPERDSIYLFFNNKKNNYCKYYEFSKDLSSKKHLFTDSGLLETDPHELVRFKNFLISSGFLFAIGDNILVFNTTNNETKIIHTNEKSPAHIITHKDKVYYSACNIVLFKENFIFLGPASIGRAINIDGNLEKDLIFKHPTGFRFPSHACISDSTLVVMGFPNRLFFINTNKMDLQFYYDIGETVIPDDNLLSFFNVALKKSKSQTRYTAIKVSRDGKYVVLVNNEKLLFFNYKKREVEHMISIPTQDGQIGTVHFSYLRGLF